MKKILCLALAAALCLMGVTVATAEGSDAWNDLMTRTVASIDKLAAGDAQMTVTGSATVTAVPDRASISLGVTFTAATVAEAQEKTNTAMGAVLAALEAAGIAKEKMATSNYSVNPVYDYSNNTSTLTGYQVSNSLSVQVEDFSKIGVVVDEATKAGANQVNGISFDTSEREKLYNDALWNAITAAKAKAQVMANAAGRELGELRTLSEGSIASYESSMRNFLAKDIAAAAPTQILGGTLEIGAQVTMVFGLK